MGLCLALRADTDRTKAVKGASIPSIPISVMQLGGHDDTFHYAKKHITVTQDGCVWRVWLNVLAGPVEGPDDQWPRLLEDRDGHW